MVDVGDKPEQHRMAEAEGFLHCSPSTIQALRANALPKGDVLAVARVAGIQAAKLTAQLIPMCHPLPLHRIAVDFEVGDESIRVTCTAETTARTGVEMEALTGVTGAALTLYDMMKSADKTMRIDGVRVVVKTKR